MSRLVDDLNSPLTNHRKRVARGLVGKVRPNTVNQVLRAFELEDEPEVYKWLAMALAHTSHPSVLGMIRRKRALCSDPNASAWLIAAEARTQPGLAAKQGEKLLTSSEDHDRTEAAIRLWGAKQFSAAAKHGLISAAGDSDDATLRRWALLGLHAKRVVVPSAIMLDNLTHPDYLLREWTLHVLDRFTPHDVRSRVIAFIEDPTSEHPRVLEWAAHAASSYDLRDPAVDQYLMDLHRSQNQDAGVYDACLAELGRRSNPLVIEYLEYVCSESRDGFVLASIVALRSANSPLPTALSAAIDDACERIEPTDPGLRYFLQNVTGPSETVRAIGTLLTDPGNRLLVRAELAKDQKDSHMEDEVLRVGVVVALLEEYEYLAEVLSLTPHHHPLTHRTYYCANVAAGGRGMEVVVGLVNDKGASRAVAMAKDLVSDYDPHVLVSLGISGHLHPKDGQLGDVVIATTTTAYLENSKAAPKGKAGYSFQAGPDTFRGDEHLTREAGLLKINDPGRFQAWLDGEVEARAPFGAPAPTVLAGPIAAGPTVVAADVFKQWVLSLNRGFLAVDMESFGVGQIAWQNQSLGNTRLLMVRGISDGANAAKDETDNSDEVPYRRLAMRAASTYLLAVLESMVTQAKLP